MAEGFRPWMPAAGNHENERLEGRPGKDPYKAYQTWFELPPNGSGPDFERLWYALTIGNVRFVWTASRCAAAARTGSQSRRRGRGGRLAAG